VLNEDDWVHIRASNTEPIVRIIAESNTELRTRELFVEFETILKEFL
jgi:phosphomannomutase